mmetsp:Transcript_135853/g.307370  ORF Transcript_135853/g.307370 Transcript_135853/m.307370 type:complete len:341 (+) Transcript_135853:774-1796(+)
MLLRPPAQRMRSKSSRSLGWSIPRFSSNLHQSGCASSYFRHSSRKRSSMKFTEQTGAKGSQAPSPRGPRSQEFSKSPVPELMAKVILRFAYPVCGVLFSKTVIRGAPGSGCTLTAPAPEACTLACVLDNRTAQQRPTGPAPTIAIRGGAAAGTSSFAATRALVSVRNCVRSTPSYCFTDAARRLAFRSFRLAARAWVILRMVSLANAFGSTDRPRLAPCLLSACPPPASSPVVTALATRFGRISPAPPLSALHSCPPCTLRLSPSAPTQAALQLPSASADAAPPGAPCTLGLSSGQPPPPAAPLSVQAGPEQPPAPLAMLLSSAPPVPAAGTRRRRALRL